MFNYFKNRKNKRECLIKNIKYILENEPYYVVIGMSRKNYNLLFGFWHSIGMGCKFISNIYPIPTINNLSFCVTSFNFYKYLRSEHAHIINNIERKNKHKFLVVSGRKYKMLTHNEFLIKEIIE